MNCWSWKCNGLVYLLDFGFTQNFWQAPVVLLLHMGWPRNWGLFTSMQMGRVSIWTLILGTKVMRKQIIWFWTLSLSCYVVWKMTFIMVRGCPILLSGLIWLCILIDFSHLNRSSRLCPIIWISNLISYQSEKWVLSCQLNCNIIKPIHSIFSSPFHSMSKIKYIFNHTSLV